jgi:hypothetical protein
MPRVRELEPTMMCAAATRTTAAGVRTNWVRFEIDTPPQNSNCSLPIPLPDNRVCSGFLRNEATWNTYERRDPGKMVGAVIDALAGTEVGEKDLSFLPKSEREPRLLAPCRSPRQRQNLRSAVTKRCW